MYCTKADLIDRFSEQELASITDHENAAVIVDSVLNTGIEDASAEMDGYIGQVLTLPLAVIPKVLLPIACNITRYKLYEDCPNEQVIKRYDDAIKFLIAVSKRQVSLGVSDSDEATASTDLAEMQSSGSVFARENSKGFI